MVRMVIFHLQSHGIMGVPHSWMVGVMENPGKSMGLNGMVVSEEKPYFLGHLLMMEMTNGYQWDIGLAKV